MLEARAVSANGSASWTAAGLGKERFDSDRGGLRLGQAFLRAEGELFDNFSFSAVASAADDRAGLADLTEAWVGWSPVPVGPWKTRVKLGAFFPASSLEIDYDSIGWTPSRTLSSAAINSWIGEELRTKGIELSLLRKGRSEGSPHDIGFSAALFAGNDPAGTVMAWRGWSIGDRITGLSEALRLSSLPVFGPNGALTQQDRNIHLFREIDHRLGYYIGAQYGYAERFKAALMHYDNRGNPLAVDAGQYSWNTRFDHLSLDWRPMGDWEFLAQALKGETIMGPNAVRASFSSWYGLASHPVGPGKLTARYDHFLVRESTSDILPGDPNSEDGRALALAYLWPFGKSLALITELLVTHSNRPARALIGAQPQQRTRSLTAGLRWMF